MANGIPDFNENTQWSKVKTGFSGTPAGNFQNMNKVQNHSFKESPLKEKQGAMNFTDGEGGVTHDPWVFSYPNAKL